MNQQSGKKWVELTLIFSTVLSGFFLLKFFEQYVFPTQNRGNFDLLFVSSGIILAGAITFLLIYRYTGSGVPAFNAAAEKKFEEQITSYIHKITEATLSEPDMDSLYKTVHGLLKEIMPADNFCIAIDNKNSGLISFPYVVDEFQSSIQSRKPANGLVEHVLSTGKALLANSETIAKFNNSSDAAVNGEQVKVWLGVPLVHLDVIIGLIVLTDYHNTEAYGTKQLEQLSSLSPHIASAIQRKQALTDMLHLENLLQSLMDNIPDRIYFKDLDSRFILVNKATAQKHNFDDPAKLIGLTDADLFSGDHAVEPLLDEQNIIRTKQPLINKEKKELLQDGSEFWSSITKAPLYAVSGEVIGTVGISRDVTKEKAAVEKLDKYAEELRLLNLHKDKLFSIIAHDLRSPFHPLLALSDMMNTEIETLSEDEIRKISAELNKLLKNQYALLENLLSWARMQSGKIEFLPVKLDLCELTENVFQLLHAVAVKKSIELVQGIKEAAFVLADRTMLQSVIQNLLTNAIKFTGTGGKVTVSINRLTEFYEIAITDTGVGISAENLNKLFNMETTFTSQGTANEKGTGLGLLICKEMVEKHGGTLRVESEAGKGSNFIFTIPAAG